MTHFNGTTLHRSSAYQRQLQSTRHSLNTSDTLIGIFKMYVYILCLTLMTSGKQMQKSKRILPNSLYLAKKRWFNVLYFVLDMLAFHNHPHSSFGFDH